MIDQKPAWKWIKRTFPDENGERFVLTHTRGTGSKGVGHGLNFWHVTPDHTYLFTFFPNETYHKKMNWTEDLFRELEANLRSPAPSVKVVRFAVDDMIIFSEKPYGGQAPKAPEAPEAPEVWQKRTRKEKLTAAQKYLRRLDIERAKNAEPAPFVLYAVFKAGGKEFAWNLTPDNPKRQGIEPGDEVLVWANDRFCKAIATRIEPADGSVIPTARVKRKLLPKENPPEEAE